MRVAKARYISGREGYSDFTRIGKKEFSFSTLVMMWNQVPDEIRKTIQDKQESDF
jgi:hypothetical protein